MTFRLPHLFAAVALHAVVLVLLVSGVQCTARVHRPPVISAVLLDPSRQEAAKQKRRDEQRRQEERRKAEQERTRRKAEQQKTRELEQQRQAKADAARKKKEDEAKRQKQAAEQKKAEDLARRKKEQEELRDRDATTKREREEKIRMEQAIQEEAMRRELDREQAVRAASEREVKLAQWAERLVAHVRQNYKIPPGAPPDFACQVRMQLLPDGTVNNAKIVKSCGSALLDQSVEDAVYRSSPMPRPNDPAVFDRDLTINFEP